MKQYIKKNLITIALMAIGGVGAFAQEVTYEAVPYTRVDSVTLHYYNKYHSRFLDNWSVEALGSARVLFAEEDGNLAFGKRICPALQLGLQKDLTPDVSVRALFSVGSFKGWNTGAPGLYKWQAGWSDEDPVRQYLEGQGIDCSNGYQQDIRYFTIGAEAMINLWNVWTVNNQLERKWTPYLFAGLEYYQMMKHNGYYRTYKIGGHAGIKCDYRLNERLDVTGEFAAAMQPAAFDNEIGKGHRMDAYAYASLGVKVHLGKRGYRLDRVLPTGEYVRLGSVVTGIKELYEVPGMKTAIIGDLFAPSIVFDDNADTYSEELQMVNLYRMAQYLNDNPSLKITVIGNTHVVGTQLAQRRAEIVRQKLIDRYGIAPTRLIATTLDVNNEFGKKGGDQAVNFGVTK